MEVIEKNWKENNKKNRKTFLSFESYTSQKAEENIYVEF